MNRKRWTPGNAIKLLWLMILLLSLTGKLAAQSLTEQTGANNPLNGVNIGTEANPAIADLDDDGDWDMFVGQGDGTVSYYLNTGTSTSPTLTQQTGASNPMDGEDVGSESRPMLWDIDNDSDFDLFIGENLGTILHYENTGTASSPTFTLRTGASNPFDGVDVGGESDITFGDIDNDGDADAFIGKENGTVDYFENTGTVSSPTFTQQTGANNPMNGFDVVTEAGPGLFDYDNDGDYDMFVGDTDGDIHYYENTGTAVNPVYSEITGAGNPFNGIGFGDEPKPFAIDLNGDGYTDIVVPDRTGTFRYFTGTNTGSGPTDDSGLGPQLSMSYSSGTSTQDITAFVFINDTDAQIIGIQIVTIGSASAIDLTALNLSTNGSTDAGNDITNAKLYYTGKVSSFSTTTQFGATSSNPNGAYTVNGTRTLNKGSNYFWLTYDINSGAAANNVVDAEVTQITVDGSNYAPSTTAPTGSRTIIKSPSYANFPYYTSFETGFFENEWLISSSNSNGRTQVTTANTPRTGSYHATRDVSVNATDNGNNMDLYINLQSQTDVEMEFYYKDWDDEDTNVDGIYLSDDAGVNFTYVHEIDPDDYTDDTWNRIVLDIDALATANGLALNNTFVIRFYQFDNNPITSDGVAIDDITIRNSPCNSPDYASLPYYEGFESGIFDTEWCTAINTNNNTTISSQNSPYVGNYHLTMDVLNNNNYDTNEALLHLDLSGETQVELSFYFKDWDDEDDNADGIYFSDDGGANFTYVFEIIPDNYTDNTWNNIILDVDALAAANTLSLNSTFVIKFLQYDNYGITSDGMAFDEIKVYGNATTWTGNTNTNWNIGVNWSNGVPDCSTLVTIPDVSGASGNFPAVNSGGTPAVGDIIIEAGAQITINSGRTLFVCGNWTNYGSAALGAGTVELQGTQIQEITGTNNFQNLTINNVGSFVRLVNDQNISGALTLTDGLINTNFNTLTMNSGSTTSGASSASFVDGPLTKVGSTDFEFPIGDGSTWAPLAIANLTGNAATQFTAEYYETEYSDIQNFKASDPNGDLNNISILEYWDLNNSGTASNTDVTLYWKDQTKSNILDYADLEISHYTGTEWENLGQASISGADPGWITVAGVSSFSPFTFGSTTGNNTLPVELVFFTAGKENENVLLDWQTASELNNDFFEVQRSENGENWEVIGNVEGNGTVNERVNYDFTDTRPLYGTSYYRLRQVDFDGQFEYSQVQSVTMELSGQQMKMSIYPNPTSEQNINIRLISANKRNVVRLRLLDLSGKLYLDETIDAEKFAQDQKIIPDRKLNSGIYILEVKQDQTTSKHKIIIL